MALPIWGIFMKKCLADPSLGISEEDRFAVPSNFNMNLVCDEDIRAASTGETEQNSDTNDYFN